MSQRPNDDYFEGTKMSFGEHLEELRVSLFRSVFALAIGSIVGLYVAGHVVRAVQTPLQRALEEYYLDKAEAEAISVFGAKHPEEVARIQEERLVPEVVLIDARQAAETLRSRLRKDPADTAPVFRRVFRQGLIAAAAPAFCQQVIDERDKSTALAPLPGEALWGLLTPKERGQWANWANEPKLSEEALVELADQLDRALDAEGLAEHPALAKVELAGDAERARALRARLSPAKDVPAAESESKTLEPKSDAPAKERPATDEPSPNPPASNTPPTDAPATDSAATDSAATDASGAEPPASDGAARKTSASDESAEGKPAGNQPAAEGAARRYSAARLDATRELNHLLLSRYYRAALLPPSAPLMELRLYKDIKKQIRVQALKAEEAFMIWVKAGVIAGAVLVSPYVFYQIWIFVAAGLYPHEKKYVYVYLPLSIGLFLAGAALAFFFVFEPVLSFLFSFNRAMNVDPDPRIGEWLGFVIILPLGFGVSFQLPLVMLFLSRLGMITPGQYLAKWRIAIVVIFVVSMILTPADPISMLLMAIPLTFLYFGGILLCHWMPRTRNPFAEGFDPRA